MIGALDIFAFVVFAVIISAAVIIVVTLGQLPGKNRQTTRPSTGRGN
jgi:hypothetical protein